MIKEMVVLRIMSESTDISPAPINLESTEILTQNPGTSSNLWLDDENSNILAPSSISSYESKIRVFLIFNYYLN
jgi:hypothetical protein